MSQASKYAAIQTRNSLWAQGQAHAAKHIELQNSTVRQVWIGLHGGRPCVLVRVKREGLPNLFQPTLYAEVEGLADNQGQEVGNRVCWAEERAATVFGCQVWEVRNYWNEEGLA